MIYRLLADVTLALHMGFILFVALGGLLAVWRRWIAWLHVPAAVWGGLIAIAGWTCPLTPLENRFRRLGGEAGYTGSFVDRYLAPVIYPGDRLGRTGFVALGIAVLVVNAAVYGWIYRRSRRDD